MVVFFVICLSGAAAFYIINSPAVAGQKLNPGNMQIGDLESVFTMGMSLLALTTNVISSYIFNRQN